MRILVEIFTEHFNFAIWNRDSKHRSMIVIDKFLNSEKCIFPDKLSNMETLV